MSTRSWESNIYLSSIPHSMTPLRKHDKSTFTHYHEPFHSCGKAGLSYRITKNKLWYKASLCLPVHAGREKICHGRENICHAIIHFCCATFLLRCPFSLEMPYFHIWKHNCASGMFLLENQSSISLAVTLKLISWSWNAK